MTTAGRNLLNYDVISLICCMDALFGLLGNVAVNLHKRFDYIVAILVCIHNMRLA